MTAIACPACGSRNDLDQVRASGYDRTLRCRSCGMVDRWEIAHEPRRASHSRLVASGEAPRIHADRSW